MTLITEKALPGETLNARISWDATSTSLSEAICVSTVSLLQGKRESVDELRFNAVKLYDRYIPIYWINETYWSDEKEGCSVLIVWTNVAKLYDGSVCPITNSTQDLKTSWTSLKYSNVWIVPVAVSWVVDISKMYTRFRKSALDHKHNFIFFPRLLTVVFLHTFSVWQ